MESKKINQLATNVNPQTSDLTTIGDPVTGQLKKITWLQVAHLIGAQASLTLQDVTNQGATTTLPITTGGLTLSNLDNGVLKVAGGVVSTYPYGQANGVASLDSGGKVPASQLPSSIMDYKGTWNAATNTPTLVNGTGDTGDVYRCNVAGTVNFGAGNITFKVGDWAIYNGTIWEQSNNSDAVSSVFGRTGDITAQEGDYNIGQLGDVTITSAATNDYLRYNGTGWVNTQFPTFVSSDKLVLQVRNTSGATINKGTVVYVNGASGGYPTIAKAQADADNTSAQTLGLVQDNISNNSNGVVVIVGQITGIDTSAYPAGTQLYLSGTTAGAFTSTKTLAPTHLVYVGIVTTQNAVNGVIEVKIQNGYELDEIHDVAISSVANNQGLFYESSTSLWKNKSIATVLGYTPEQPLTFSAPLSRSTNTVSIPAATGSVNGYLTSTDWTTFNNKITNPMTTLGDIIFGGTSGNPNRLAGNTTTTKQYLSQTGTGTDSASPTWATITGSDITGAALTKTDDTNVTLTLGGTPATALLRAASLTLGWTGQLSVARGGTGLSALGTAGQLLRVNTGATALEYFTPTYISAAITSLNGLTDSLQTFATGTTGTDFNISSASGVHTFNIPSASAANRGLVTTGAQTFAGNKTFSGNVIVPQISINGANQTFRQLNYTTAGSNRWSIYASDTNESGSNAGSNLIITRTNDDGTTSNVALSIERSSGNTTITENLTAKALIKTGGTSSQYLMADGSTSTLTNPVTGTGTQNYIPKWNNVGGTSIGNSRLYDNGSTVQIGSTSVTDSDFFILGGGGTTSQSQFVANAATDRYLLVVRNNEASGAVVDIRSYGSSYTETIFGQTMANSTAIISQTNSKFLIGNISNKPIIFGTNDAERVRITEGGSLYVTTKDDQTAAGVPSIQLGGNNDQPHLIIKANTGTADANTGYLIFARSAGTTDGSKTLVGNNDRLGMIRWEGADGTGFSQGAVIMAEVDGTTGVGDMPTRLVFQTTADGASSPTTRLTINNAGLATFTNIPAFGSASDAFVISDSGTLRTRSAAQVRSDIGAQAALTNPITGDGSETSGNIAFFTGNTTIAGTTSLNWDNANGRMTIGKASTDYRLEVYGGTKPQIVANGGTSLGAGIALLNELSGTDRRNWIINTESTDAGDFEILRSTAAGGNPSIRTLQLNKAGELTIFNFFNLVNAITPAIYLNNTSRVGGTGKNWSLLNGNIAAGAFSIKNETDNTTPFVISGSGVFGFNLPANGTGTGMEFGFGTTPRINFLVSSVYTMEVNSTSTQGYIKTNANIPLLFGTNDSPRMRILAGGSVIINGTTDEGTLTVNGAAATTALRINAASGSVAALSIGGAGSFVIDAPGVGGGRFLITNTGQTFINTGGAALQSGERLAVASADNAAILAQYTGGATAGWAMKLWNNAASGNNNILEFTTEASITARGAVAYNRTLNALSISGSNALNFAANGANRMLINSSGMISINEDSPLANMRLYINTSGSNISGTADWSSSNTRGIMLNVSENSTESVGIWFRTGGNHLSGISGQRSGATGTVDGWATDLRFYTHQQGTSALTTATERMRISSEGEVWIGYTSDQGAYLLQVAGAVQASGGFFDTSDYRVKNILERNPNVKLDLDLIKYTKKDDEFNTVRYGYIAQEVQKIMPELVGGKDILSLNYQDIHSILIYNLMNRIKQLESKLN